MSKVSRFGTILNLGQYRTPNTPLLVGLVDVQVPTQDQYVLRCLVSDPQSGGTKFPDFLEWTRPLLESAQAYQRTQVGIRHPYCYLTVRHGTVVSRTDDAWHVDGFSMRYHHLPEANYVWVQGGYPTVWANQGFDIPEGFDPLVHNIHSLWPKLVDPSKVESLSLGQQYLIDPYVVHKRPPEARGSYRTFVRVTFAPIEIPDIKNTRNPLLPTPHYLNDGVAYRNTLKDFYA